MERTCLIIATTFLLPCQSQQIPITVHGSRVQLIPPVEGSMSFQNSSIPRAMDNWVTDISSSGFGACTPSPSDVVDSLIVMRYISTAPANEIIIKISYHLRCCAPSISWKRSIGLYVFMSSTALSVIPNPNISPYTYVGELRNTSVMQGATTMAFTSHKAIEMMSFRGIYLGFRDRGICGGINSVSIHYYMCPYSSIELMRFPTTAAPNTSKAVVRINGACLANSEPGKSDNFMLCYANGTAKIHGRCQCLPGYQNVSSSQCTGKPRTFTNYYLNSVFSMEL